MKANQDIDSKPTPNVHKLSNFKSKQQEFLLQGHFWDAHCSNVKQKPNLVFKFNWLIGGDPSPPIKQSMMHGVQGEEKMTFVLQE